MAELKTRQNDESVEKFISGIADEQRREDCVKILKIMRDITKAEPKMWGSSIVGFGNHHYKYDSGREGDWFITGFSPRKQNLTLYFMSGLQSSENLLKKLGKHKIGKGCLYIRSIEDIDLITLKELIKQSVKSLTKK